MLPPPLAVIALGVISVPEAAAQQQLLQLHPQGNEPSGPANIGSSSHNTCLVWKRVWQGCYCESQWLKQGWLHFALHLSQYAGINSSTHFVSYLADICTHRHKARKCGYPQQVWQTAKDPLRPTLHDAIVT